MTIYYVYQLIDPRTNSIFYVGKGKGDRAKSHLNFTSGCNNPHKDRVINKIYNAGLTPIIEYVRYFDVEEDAYTFEEQLTESIGLKNLTNIVIGAQPPNKSGWVPTVETRQRRSNSLRNIPRTEEWCSNLSKSKSGKNNPMHGTTLTHDEKLRRSLANIITKNAPNYQLYKEAISLMNDGASADTVAVQLGIGRGVCFKLKNRSHNFFVAYPELR